jgi:hypothetical protein
MLIGSLVFIPSNVTLVKLDEDHGVASDFINLIEPLTTVFLGEYPTVPHIYNRVMFDGSEWLALLEDCLPVGKKEKEMG